MKFSPSLRSVIGIHRIALEMPASPPSQLLSNQSREIILMSKQESRITYNESLIQNPPIIAQPQRQCINHNPIVVHKQASRPYEPSAYLPTGMPSFALSSTFSLPSNSSTLVSLFNKLLSLTGLALCEPPATPG